IEVPGDKTEWTVDRPLKRGAIYEWHITATLSNSRLKSPEINPEPRFQIAPREAVQRCLNEQIRQSILYAQEGLYEQADAVLNAMIQENLDPEITEQATKLRKNMETQHDSSHK